MRPSRLVSLFGATSSISKMMPHRLSNLWRETLTNPIHLVYMDARLLTIYYCNSTIV
jgi:hypothetical protein